MADLIRALTIPCRVDFVRLASYGSGSVSSGEVRITKDLETPIAGRDVLIVEDIVDTGLTLSRLVEILRERRPASLRVCAFLDKAERRRVPFTADYVGFTIPDRFVVGYGLDYNEKFRFLPDVCVLEGHRLRGRHMIIQCRKCETRFRFDETLIEGDGVWVRCSRCQNVFFQERPSGETPSSAPSR